MRPRNDSLDGRATDSRARAPPVVLTCWLSAGANKTARRQVALLPIGRPYLGVESGARWSCLQVGASGTSIILASALLASKQPAYTQQVARRDHWPDSDRPISGAAGAARVLYVGGAWTRVLCNRARLHH